MAKKYDTNPLDADVLKRAENEHSAANGSTPAPTRENLDAPTKVFEANTRAFHAKTAPVMEAPTQRYDQFDPSAPYQSVFNNPISNSPVTAAMQYHVEPPTSRRIVGLGIPENIAMLLPYLPFTFGAIAAVIELVLVSRSETRVRFHAAQGLALHVAWFLIAVILWFAGIFTDMASFSSRVFSFGMTIFFIFSIYRVWKGKPHHIEALDDLTDFFNEKLKPRR